VIVLLLLLVVVFGCVLNGQEELVMAEKVIGEKSRRDGEFRISIVSLRKIF
jgi:hypothetical protein